MERCHPEGEDFIQLEQVAEISPRKRPAGVATARLIHRREIVLITSVQDVKLSAPSEDLTVPGVSSRDNAVEHIHAASTA